MRKVFIATEDTFGELFIKKIIKKLKDENIIPNNVKVLVKAMPKRCSVKLSKILKLYCIEGYHKLILLVDGDGKNELRIKKKELEHGKHIKRCKLEVIVNKYEIEEWLLFAYGKNFSGKPKPSIEIKKIIPWYDKNRLHKVLEIIMRDSNKWNKLRQYEKFRELVNKILR